MRRKGSRKYVYVFKNNDSQITLVEPLLSLEKQIESLTEYELKSDEKNEITLKIKKPKSKKKLNQF
jgi:hypothetical protein